MQEELQRLVNESQNIVFFGGAGVSTESGIPDFRSTDGLYNQKYKYPPEVILSHDFFLEYTEEFYRFYREKMIYADAEPNKAHITLARFEHDGKLKAVITQNIDNLHQKAGSINVLELHGSVYSNYCMDCHKFYPLEVVLETKSIPRCTCGGIIKPDVVLYGEQLDNIVVNKAIATLRKADLLIIGGTSLNVYPAAGLINYFNGKNTVVINKSPTSADKTAILVLCEPIGEVLST
ncbi:MAG: NAD-dependent protein deacylase [Clostridiales bacterium GWF2_36_10]|nr:MAG: NAD-dependent protein deacylase [Clostridiales bacterium GWF2_36_10]